MLYNIEPWIIDISDDLIYILLTYSSYSVKACGFDCGQDIIHFIFSCVILAHKKEHLIACVNVLHYFTSDPKKIPEGIKFGMPE